MTRTEECDGYATEVRYVSKRIVGAPDECDGHDNDVPTDSSHRAGECGPGSGLTSGRAAVGRRPVRADQIGDRDKVGTAAPGPVRDSGGGP